MINCDETIACKKRLSVSEKSRHYITIPLKCRHRFPETEKLITFNVNNVAFSVYYDRYYRLHIGSEIFNFLEIDRPASTVIIQKVDGKYVMKKDE
jgi:hypothetical protein